MSITANTGLQRGQWPDHVIQRGYEIWRGPARQNQKVTANLLSAEIGETVAPSTLSGWVRSHDWETRFATEWFDAGQVQSERFVAGIWNGAIPAVEYLQRVVEGKEVGDSDRVAAARILVTSASRFTIEQSKRDDQGDRRKKRKPPKPEVPLFSKTELANLTSDELVALEQQFRNMH